MTGLAIDFETYLINEEEGFSPRPVCLSYANNLESGVLLAKEVSGFLLSRDPEEIIIAHNMAFEFGVIYKHYPELRSWILGKLEKGQVYCTYIAEVYADIQKLKPHHKYSLADLVQIYFAQDISEDKKNPDSWRLRYSELDGLPLEAWPQEAIDYSLMDSVWAYRIKGKQSKSHIDSVRAACVLALASDEGLEVRKDFLQVQLLDTLNKMEPLRNLLLLEDLAYIDKFGKFKKRSKVFREKLKEEKDIKLIYTDKLDKEGEKTVSIARKSLKEYGTLESDSWLEYAKLEKKYSSFLLPLSKVNSKVRTSYNALVNTGRMSARASSLLPSLNFQQIPRDDNVRECLNPRPGYKMVSIDYASLELVSCAHKLFEIYGKSEMLDALNYGSTPVDLHSMTGSKLMSIDEGKDISYEEFVDNKKDHPYSNYRKLGKVINLSLPGGVGAKKMVDMAKDSYGVILTYPQSRELKKLFFEIYPELGIFLSKDIEQLKTGHFITFKNPKDKTQELKTDEYYYKVEDFIRRGCMYCPAANGLLMQTPSAFGAKKAVYRLGIMALKSDEEIILSGFIHDECILQIKDNENLYTNIEKCAIIMVESMQTVFPYARVAVEADYGDFWSKSHGNEKLFWKDRIK